jgi:hypothetical protein
MIILKKTTLFIYFKSLCYFNFIYKISSLYINNNLLKKEFWSWPIVTNFSKQNIYNSFF